MSKERDHGSGRYVEKATLEDVLGAFDAVDGPPVVTTADVADATGISRDSARRKLETLRENGRVERRKSAGRVLYWPADESRDEQTQSERRETGESTAQSDDGREGRDDTSDTSHDTPAGLGTVEYPDKRDRDACERAVFAARDYIRDHDGATKGEIVRGVMPDHALGYDVTAALEKLDSSNRYRGGWWRNVVTEGLEALDDVQKPDPGAGTWEYSGDGADPPARSSTSNHSAPASSAAGIAITAAAFSVAPNGSTPAT